jgi:catechol 2,3-dioxygenase-like lactoylglutathione lyase family enzyme
METNAPKTFAGLQLAQIAWVVKDINATIKFFKEVLGINNLSKPEISRAQDYKATYHGELIDAETLVSMAYSGGTFIELIQPLSGHSMFHDYLEKNPEGGMQHVAYSTPVANLDKIITDLKDKGYPVISVYDTSIAKIIFIDTYKELGVVTEIMGITEEGEKAVQKMKGGKP